MITPALLEEFERLSVDERIQLLQDLWDRVCEDPRNLPPLSEIQREELDRRLAAHDADPDRVIPADEVFQRLQQRQGDADSDAP